MNINIQAVRRLSAIALGFSIAFAPGITVAQEDEMIEEIVTLGTRSPGRVSADLAVAVDTLSADEMAATGQTEVGRMLQSIAPSFNFSSSSISDGTDALRPATLRGLGPDQTLVLVNGKRRHQASLPRWTEPARRLDRHLRERVPQRTERWLLRPGRGKLGSRPEY